jgi:hypothetical protein
MGLRTWLGIKNRLRRHPLAGRDEYAQPVTGQERLRAVLRALTPKRAVGVEKVRVGCHYDGGYVMLDDFDGIAAAVSCGVGINWAWDRDIAERGIPVSQFEKAPVHAATEGLPIAVRGLRVSGADGPGNITLDTISDELDAAPASLLLKVDIEGDEWDAIAAASSESLAIYAQIVVEFHDLGLAGDAEHLSAYEAVVAKLAHQFQSVHVHGNNHAQFCSVFNVVLPDVLEVTFANRARYKFVEAVETFPTALDMPNKKDAADLWLGSFIY